MEEKLSVIFGAYRALETNRKLAEKIYNALSVGCLPPSSNSFMVPCKPSLRRQGLENTCWNCMFCELLSGVLFLSHIPLLSGSEWHEAFWPWWPTVNVHIEGRMPICSFWCLVGSDQVTGKQCKVYFYCLSCRMETSALVMANPPPPPLQIW